MKGSSQFGVSERRQPSWRTYVNGLIAAEISKVTRYMDDIIQMYPRELDTFMLLQAIDCSGKVRLDDISKMPDLSKDNQRVTGILLNGSFNHSLDVSGMLDALKPRLSRSSRVFAVLYNPYLRWFYSWANRFGIRKGPLPCSFITQTALFEMAKLAGFEVVRARYVGYCPWRLSGLGNLINAILPVVPLFKWFSFAYLAILRPIVTVPTNEKQSLSIVIPARNEKGNIESALKRMPTFNRKIEIIFVEGHSTDSTWEEILRVRDLYSGRFDIKAVQQKGKGKNDAVRLGFSMAQGQLLTIIDADLTMPPECLGQFLDAYDRGLADFVNGSRLIYPMEGEAMRFLNLLGNIFFAKMLSACLQVNLSDTLCGTKLLARHDYERICKWRKDFGEFDPFGDFELLFPSAVFGLGIINVAVNYRARSYGVTNINRFHHGLILLSMSLVGFLRIRLGAIHDRSR